MGNTLLGTALVFAHACRLGAQGIVSKKVALSIRPPPRLDQGSESSSIVLQRERSEIGNRRTLRQCAAMTRRKGEITRDDLKRKYFGRKRRRPILGGVFGAGDAKPPGRHSHGMSIMWNMRSVVGTLCY
jgi:hypothetical protein